MPRTPAQKKGDSLEDAVRSIEETILKTAPGFAEGTFKIYNKRVVVADGVRHEIDIYVVASLPSGYESIFVFECKNWASAVGKNEVIILSEKVSAVGATRGFLVSTSFSKNAYAQAKKDQRVSLLLASQIQPVVRLEFPQFVSINFGKTDATVQIKFTNAEGVVPHDILSRTGKEFQRGSDVLPFGTFISRWIEEARSDAANVQGIG